MNDLARLSPYPIHGSYIPLSTSELESAQRVVGQGKLPECLVAVFNQFGCASFKNSVFINTTKGKFPVTYLFGGGRSSYAVLENLNSLEELPMPMLPFAGDEFGNLFCYKASGPNPGVYRWDHERAIEVGVNPSFLNSSVEDFFVALEVRGNGAG